MKTEREVKDFEAEAARRVYNCKLCKGALDVKCECTKRFNFEKQAYEACIPRDFWDTRPEDIEHNVAAFKRYVLPYVKRIRTAHRNGYGLCFSGSNGVGKTMFISYVLACAIRSGRSAYYTTMLQLDWDIKAGFGDREHQARLEWMLTSDFLAIDEMGKEQHKALGTKSHTQTQLERILKKRFDAGCQPVLVATNLSAIGLGKAYGDTVLSMVRGKMETVNMESGDIRVAKSREMRAAMGYVVPKDDEE